MSDTYYGGLAADSQGINDGRPAVVLLHGLGADRRQWGPVRRELALLDPERRVVALDLPGHGGSPRRDSYALDEVAAVVHGAVTEAGLTAPTVAGHSLGGVLATVYGATYPVRGVVNVDQPLLVGGFAEMLRRAEPVLRSPDRGQIWDFLIAGMRPEALPDDMRELVQTATPAQELLLGYWNELLTVPAEELTERRTRDLSAIRAKAATYDYVAGDEPATVFLTWLTSVMPEVSITVVPGSGHFPHLAAPADLAKILTG